MALPGRGDDGAIIDGFIPRPGSAAWVEFEIAKLAQTRFQIAARDDFAGCCATKQADFCRGKLGRKIRWHRNISNKNYDKT